MTWLNLDKADLDKVRHVLDVVHDTAATEVRKRIDEQLVDGPNDEAYRDAADDPFGEVNIDPGAPVSVSTSGGAWVLSWLFVSDAEAGL